MLVLVLCAFFLECLLHPFSWAPSFLFILVIFISLGWREQAGAMAGFLVGIFYAGLFAEPPGLSALTLTLAGYLAGKTAPFLMDTPGIVLFVFAFIIFIMNDLLASMVMSIFYSSFWQIRFCDALSGGLVFSLVCNPLQRIFFGKRI